MPPCLVYRFPRSLAAHSRATVVPAGSTKRSPADDRGMLSSLCSTALDAVLPQVRTNMPIRLHKKAAISPATGRYIHRPGVAGHAVESCVYLCSGLFLLLR